MGMILRLIAVSGITVAASVAGYPLLSRIYTANVAMLLQLTNQEGATTWNQSISAALDDNAIQTKTDILRSARLQEEVIKEQNLMTDREFNPALHPLRQAIDSMPWLAHGFRRSGTTSAR
jgi:uncharacterized protein involved in exopolysaccharide biosynthesis